MKNEVTLDEAVFKLATITKGLGINMFEMSTVVATLFEIDKEVALDLLIQAQAQRRKDGE